jgi:hypothetical protein
MTYVYDDTTSGLSRTIGPLNLGTTYYWRVRGRNAAGFGLFSSVRAFKTILTSAVDHLDGVLPREYTLSQNYPNPFNPTTSLEFHVASSSDKGGSPPANQVHEWRAGASGGGFVSLKIFDLLGREVATLVDEKLSPGRYSVRWNAERFPSGVYFYRLTTGSFGATKRLVLVK